MTLVQVVLLITAVIVVAATVAFGALAVTLIVGMVRASLPSRRPPLS